MSKDQTGAILERIEDKLGRFAEAMADVPRKVDSIDMRLSQVEQDMKVIKAVLKGHNHELTDHESRITRLEGVMPSRG